MPPSRSSSRASRRTTTSLARGKKDCAVRPVDAPSPCLRTRCGSFPTAYVSRKADGGRVIAQCRKFSVADLAKVQGWPASAAMALPPGRTSACKILGNSVSPPVMRWVAEHVETILTGEAYLAEELDVVAPVCWRWRARPDDAAHLSRMSPPKYEWPRRKQLACEPPAAELIRQQAGDPILGPIAEFLAGEPLPAGAVAAKLVRDRAANYMMRDGVLFHINTVDVESAKHQIAVPQELVKPITAEAHSGAVGAHVGTTKLTALLRQRFYWKGMHGTIRAHVKKCQECKVAKHKLGVEARMRQPMLAAHPWYYVHIDLWDPCVDSSEGYKSVLTVIDRMTHYPELIPIKDKSAKTVAKAFFENVICRHGVPAVVVSDNGPEFDGIFEELQSKYGIRRIRTSAYHPQANGIIERLHSYLKGVMSAMGAARQAEWHSLLPVAAFAYRATPVSRMGYSPFHLMHAREPVIPGELRAGNIDPAPVYEEAFVRGMRLRLRAAFAAAREAEVSEKARRMDKSPWIPEVIFEKDDRVLLHRQVIYGDDSPKLTPRWHPQVVVRRRSDHSYDVQDAMGLRHKRVHVKHLRRDHTQPAPEIDRRGLEPRKDALGSDHDELAPEPETFVILRGERENDDQDDWFLAWVLPDQESPRECQIQYFNRGNRALRVDRQVFRPAFVTSDPPFKEMYTYFHRRDCPKFQPYTRTVPADLVMLTDVRLTANSTICMADIRRISDHDAINWAFRPKKLSRNLEIELDVGVPMLRKFGQYGWHVGEITDILEEDDEDPVGYSVTYQDGEIEDLDEPEALLAAREYLRSGYTDTEEAAQPGRGNLHAKRLAQRMALRPAARTVAQLAELERTRRRRRRSRAAAVLVPHRRRRRRSGASDEMTGRRERKTETHRHRGRCGARRRGSEFPPSVAGLLQ